MLYFFDFQPLADRRNCGAGGFFANLDQGGAASEIVVAEAGDVRLNHQVGAGAGLGAVNILCYGEALSDDVKNMARAAIATLPMAPQADGKNFVGAHVASR